MHTFILSFIFGAFNGLFIGVIFSSAIIYLILAVSNPLYTLQTLKQGTKPSHLLQQSCGKMVSMVLKVSSHNVKRGRELVLVAV